MSAAGEILADAWAYKVSLLPVFMTYLLFDAQAIYRRATRTWYVPIYFIVFPNGHSDKLYAEYFSEDDFYGDGSAMTAAEKQSLRHKIIVSAILSMQPSSPLICADSFPQRTFHVSSSQNFLLL